MAYHLNPTTGQPGLCRATVRCPFGLAEDHHTTIEDARDAYERIMTGAQPEPLAWTLPPKNSLLRAPEDQRAFTRACFDEGEEYRLRFPLANNGRWAHRPWPQALRWYTQGGFAPINAVLRGYDHDYYGDAITDEYVTMVNERVPALDALFKDAPRHRRVVYRYTDLPDRDVQGTLAHIEETRTFTDPGFMSTSASMDFPLLEVLKYPEKNRVLLEIAIDGPAIPLQEEEEAATGDTQSHEHEILLPRNQRFEVVGVDRRRRAEVGSLRDTYLGRHEWMWSAAERKIAKTTTAQVPVVRMVQVNG